jgi:type II secretory pathway component GspD/PulD (secretin)
MIFLTPTIVKDPRELAMMTRTEQRKSQVQTNSFTEQELEQYLNQKPEEKYKFSEPPPYK